MEIATTSGRGTMTSCDLLVREVEDLVEHLLFFLVDDARVLGRRDHHPDLRLVRDHDACGRRVDPEDAGEERWPTTGGAETIGYVT